MINIIFMISMYKTNILNYIYKFFNFSRKKEENNNKIIDKFIESNKKDSINLKIYIILYNDMNLKGNLYNLDFETHYDNICYSSIIYPCRIIFI